LSSYANRADEQFVKQLERFILNYGNTSVPISDDFRQLQMWCATKRKEKKRGNIDPAVSRKLDEMGFEWEMPISKVVEEEVLSDDDEDSNEAFEKPTHFNDFQILYSDPELQQKFFDRLKDIEERNAQGLRPQNTPWKGNWTKEEKSLFRAWIMKFRHQSYRTPVSHLMESLREQLEKNKGVTFPTKSELPQQTPPPQMQLPTEELPPLKSLPFPGAFPPQPQPQQQTPYPSTAPHPTWVMMTRWTPF